jgi:hypothetical protein
MPIGPYADFPECLTAQQNKGKTAEEAKKICGALEQRAQAQAKTADIVEKFTDTKGRFFVKAFLIDDSMNMNKWAVTKESIAKNINTFIGKPLVLTENFDHPGAEQDSLQHWLSYQEPFRVGTIIDITSKPLPDTGGTAYYAIIEVTNPKLQQSLRDNKVPLYVSPGLGEHAGSLSPSGKTEITDWTGIHLAIVSEPAFGIKKAVINQSCGGDKADCLMQLRKAHVAKFGADSCGFCIEKALNKLAILHTASKTKTHTSHDSKSSPQNSKSMSQLETIESTNPGTQHQQQLQQETKQPENVQQQQQHEQINLNKQPVQPIAQQPTSFSDLMSQYQRLQDENKLLKIKNEELSNVKDTLGERIAALENQSRREAVERIITADVIKDPKARIEKIKYFVATSIPLDQIEELYKDIKVTLRKASVQLGSHAARVPYLSPSTNTTVSNISTGSPQIDEETGLTQLQKQLAVMRGGI